MKVLKTVALFEGLSLISLMFIAMPAKYLFDMPILVKLIGPAHGTLFLAFIGVLLFSFLTQKLSLLHTLLGMVASFIPFGTFVFTAKCLSADTADIQ